MGRAMGRRGPERAWLSTHRLGRSHQLDGVWRDGRGRTTGGRNQQGNSRAHGQAGDDYSKERDEVADLAKMIEEGDGLAMVHGCDRPSPNERWSAAGKAERKIAGHGNFAVVPWPAAFGLDTPHPAAPTAKLAAAAKCAVTRARLWKRMSCSGGGTRTSQAIADLHRSRHVDARAARSGRGWRRLV